MWESIMIEGLILFIQRILSSQGSYKINVYKSKLELLDEGWLIIHPWNLELRMWQTNF